MPKWETNEVLMKSANTSAVLVADANIAKTEQKKKNKKILIIILCILFALIFLFVVGFVGYRLASASHVQDIPAEIVIDPQIVSAESVTHINGADRLSVNLARGDAMYTKSVAAEIKEGEYVKYSITITNSSEQSVLYKFSVISGEIEGFDLFYQVSDGEKCPYQDNFNGRIGKKQSISIQLFIEPQDISFGEISGVFVLILEQG